MRELKTNVSIYIEDSDKAGVFNVKARGAMQVAVLVETMRREGFELLVSRPTVIEKVIDGKRSSPSRPSGSKCPTSASARSCRILPTARAC
jgi:GTP-binding protein